MELPTKKGEIAFPGPETKGEKQHKTLLKINGWLGGGFKYFLFSPLLGEMIQFDEHIFQMG